MPVNLSITTISINVTMIITLDTAAMVTSS